MNQPIYQVDAFASRPFAGNPAAVCPLDEWLSDELMQAIAAENNLAETAFFVKSESGYDIRWFTPAVEVDLCGHATLAAAHVLWSELGERSEQLRFGSRSGELLVTNKDGRLVMDFPAEVAAPCEVPTGMSEALGVDIDWCLFNQDYVVVMDDEAELRALQPDFRALGQLEEARGIIVTSAAQDYDFVCRFFGPAVGIDEDPVTGSAFTKLIPLWSERLGKSVLTARQVSNRGGDVWCELVGDRVLISGYATTYLAGSIDVVQSM